MPDDQFEPVAERVLDWCRRLDQAPDCDQAGKSLVAMSYFNRGLMHLRRGRISQARQAFESAQHIYPAGPILDEVSGLQTYDRHAREVARRVRAIAEQYPMRPVAAKLMSCPRCRKARKQSRYLFKRMIQRNEL